jgi:tetratricopeptide (TPR) repeat protein
MKFGTAKLLSGVGLLIALCVGIGLFVRGDRRVEATASAPSTEAIDLRLATPADSRVRSAQEQIKRSPSAAGGYQLLCSAFAQKARETGDFSFNQRAEAALDRANQIDPDNYDSLKLRAKLALTFHRFAEALELAKKAQALRPEDHDVYGALTDAYVELGQYEQAIAAAQKMVNLRPDTASYSRVSYLRTLHGDTEGAITAMKVAVKAADPSDPESVAWCRVQLGIELLHSGATAEAEREFDRALTVFPEYHLALAAKGQARVAAGDLETAIALYLRAQQRVPLPETAIALGDLYTRAGRGEAARQQYQLVEFIEQGNAGATYSRLLAIFYADHDVKVDEALALARREREVRADIYASDTLAWCLFKTGDLDAASREMEQALRLKTRDARLYFHAGAIADARGESRKAVEFLRKALAIDPNFDSRQAEQSRKLLAKHQVDLRGKRNG